MDIQYITHCIDEQYWLITIHRLGDMLIHIILSKTLKKQLLKQKNKPNSIKTGVYMIKQSTLLLNRVYHHMTSNLINKWIEKKMNKQKKIIMRKGDRTIKKIIKRMTYLCIWYKDILDSYYK